MERPSKVLPSTRIIAWFPGLHQTQGGSHNLTRAAGVLAGGMFAKARAATLRRKLICVPARIAHRARRLILHLPAHWPWQQAWHQLSTMSHAPPPV